MQGTWQSAQRQSGMLLAAVCSLIDPRYSWHESAWNGAHRWNSSADRSEHAGGRIRLIVISVPDSLPAGWLIWSTCTGSLAMKYLGQSEKDGAQLETAKKRKKWTKNVFSPLNYPAKFLGSNLLSASWSCKYITTLEPRQGSSGSRTKCNTLV